jgi:hypothetical protein
MQNQDPQVLRLARPTPYAKSGRHSEQQCIHTPLVDGSLVKHPLHTHPGATQQQLWPAHKARTTTLISLEVNLSSKLGATVRMCVNESRAVPCL